MAKQTSAFLEASILRHQAQVADDTRKQMKLPMDHLETDVSRWLAITGWSTHLAGLDARILHEAARSPTHTETKLVLMSNAVDTLLDRYQKAAQSTISYPAVIRRLVCSNTSNEEEIDPMEPTLRVTSKRFQEYVEIWTRLMAHLLRTYQLPDTNRMVLSKRQKELVAVLDGNLSIWNTEGIINDILQLSLSILEQNIPRSRFESPLLHFLAIMALDPVDFTWIDAGPFISVLSGVIHVGQIMILNHKYLAHTEREDASSFTTYCRKHLTDGSLSAIRDVKELLQQAYAVADHRSICIQWDWVPTLNGFQYQDKVITFRTIYTLLEDLLEEVRETLCNKLVFQSRQYLTSRKPALFRDEMPCAKVGFSFAEIESNKLLNGAKRVLNWLCREDEAFERMVDKGSQPPRFSADAIREYVKDARDFVYKLALLCYLGAGYPPADVDFLALKVENNRVGMRTLYIDGGDVCIITRPTKTSSLELRYLPNSLGEVMIAYVGDVLPFLRFLHRSWRADNLERISEKLDFGSSFLWATPDVWVLREELDEMLIERCSETLGAAIGLKEWRFAASAIDHHLLHQVFTMAGVNERGKSQHPWQTEDQTFKLPQTIHQDLLMTLTAGDKRTWRDASTDWHQELGLMEVEPMHARKSPRVPPKPLALSSPGLYSTRNSMNTTVTPRKRPRLSVSPRRDQFDTSSDLFSSLSFTDRTLEGDQTPNAARTRSREGLVLDPLVLAHQAGSITPNGGPLNPEEGRKHLRTIFNSFANETRCVVCWLAHGALQANHSFTSCEKNKEVTVKSIKDFIKVHLRWKKNCHFGCGAPEFVCGRYKGGGCKYINILIPAIMYACSSPKYEALVLAGFPDESLTSMAELGLVTGKGAMLYEYKVTFAIVLFDFIMRTVWLIEEPFNG